MAIAPRLQDWLSRQQADFRIATHDERATFSEIAQGLGVPPSHIARVVTVRDRDGTLAVILPADHLLDFDALQELTGRSVDVVDAVAADRMFAGCVSNCRPALTQAFNLPMVVDSLLLQNDPVYCEAGDGQTILEFTRGEFQRLLGDVLSASLATPPSVLHRPEGEGEDVVTQFLPMRLKQRVQETFDLPAMPDLATEILRLRVDPNASARQLADVVNRDPSLAAQIMSWANSPYYGFPGRITSIEMAIMRVLGFDVVMNLALGITVGRSLRVPREGPLGLKAFWHHAVLCAVLAERLSLRLPASIRPPRGLVYLSGLLHNFGHLLLGHVFPPQFFLVNRYVAANPQLPIDDIERHVLGVSHEEIGAWLMQAWHMPEELITAVRWHHQEEFSSQHAVYSNLVLIANRLLKRVGVGDASSMHLPDAVLAMLQLSETDAVRELAQLDSSREELATLSQKLVA